MLLTEHKVLQITEDIIQQIASKLIANKWTVEEIFGHPKLITVIESYEEQENVASISA